MSIRSIAAAVFLAAPTVADAQAFRTYLASTGVDNASCNLASPCRLLPAALAAVADKGEVWILDSANYNLTTVQVTKSVTVLAVPGALGSLVSTNGQHAMFISTAGVEVTLRNLVFVPVPDTGALSGVVMTAGSALTIEDCVFANLPQYGLYAANGMEVRVGNTLFRDNVAAMAIESGVRAVVTGSTFSGNSGSGLGLYGRAGHPPTRADVADTTFEGNGAGAFLFGTNGGASVASVRDSHFIGNTSTALLAQSEGGGTAVLTASNNIIANNNGPGLYAVFPGSRIWASGNTITDNKRGIWNFGGVFETAGDNAVRNNTSPEVEGPVVVVAPQ